LVRIELLIELRYDVAPPGADFIFNIHGAHTRCQTIMREQLQISQQLVPQLFTDAVTHNRYLRLSAWPGPLSVSYQATVDLNHILSKPEDVYEVPVARLPPQVLAYIYPSRYCQSDQLGPLVMGEFAHMQQGYRRVQAICDWVHRRVKFESNTTTSATSALDTLRDGKGVCRDFAHLMIAMCRALSIPARFATGIDFGADPAMGPTDFHAYVEVYLGGRWYIFDPSDAAIPMGFVRFGTGRDAADVSFATIFGTVQSQPPRIEVHAMQDPHGRWETPYRRTDAISTDGGEC
jgi:transglutaminase-like putative cysteine protease